jgi:hypothetical protein
MWFSTYYPKITNHRVTDNLFHLKRMYVKSKLIQLAIFIVFGIGFILIGPYLLTLIHSKTQLLSTIMILSLLFFAYLDSNQSIAISLLLTGNEVPFMKSTLFTGILTVTVFFGLLNFTTLGIWSLILAPGISQLIYQDWKWPKTVKENLEIKFKDYWFELIRLFESLQTQIRKYVISKK